MAGCGVAGVRGSSSCVVVVRGCVLVLGIVGRQLRRAFAFLAEELAVAQAQEALVDADAVGTLRRTLGRQPALLASSAPRRR